MAGRTFLDTNVLVYLFDGRDAEKRRKALDAYSDLDPDQVVLSTQVLQEFYWNVTKKIRPPLAQEVAADRVRDFSAHTVVVLDVATILAAVARSTADGIAFWDGLIVEAALSAGCTRILTEDLQDGRIFDTLRVENPFRR